MTKCAYCNKPLERNVFCSNSHRVMYHKKGKAPKLEISEKTKEVYFNPVPKPKKGCK